MFKVGPRIRETTATTGTGTLSLAGATTGMQTFVAGIGTTNTTRYCIVSGNGTDWEIGLGTVTSGSPNTLSRTIILSSTNSGAAISLTGTSSVFCVTEPFGNNGLFGPVLSTVPTQAGTGFTTQVQSGLAIATFTDGATGIAITAPANASAHGISYVTKAAPSTMTRTATALIALAMDLTNNYAQVAFGYSDGTKLQVLAFTTTPSVAGFSLGMGDYTNKTTLTTAPITFGSSAKALAPVIWLQIQDDGTNVHYLTSTDGATFVQCYTVAKSAGFLGSAGYANVVFGIDPYSAVTAGTLMSYTET